MDNRKKIAVENKLREAIQAAFDEGWKVRPGLDTEADPRTKRCCLVGAVVRDLDCSGEPSVLSAPFLVAKERLDLHQEELVDLENGFEKRGCYYSADAHALGAQLRAECDALFSAQVLAFARSTHRIPGKIADLVRSG